MERTIEERLKLLEEVVMGMEGRLIEQMHEIYRPLTDAIEKHLMVKVDAKKAEKETELKQEDATELPQPEFPEHSMLREDKPEKTEKSKAKSRLSGKFDVDWDGEKEKEWKPRTFVQNLNYIFQYAVESKRSKAKYIEQSNNVFGKRDLAGFKFVSQSIIAIAKTLVKILHEVETSDIGMLQPTDFVSPRILNQAVDKYKGRWRLPDDSVLSRKIKNQFDDVTNFVDESTGFGCMVMCIILSAERGNGVSAITSQGFNRLKFWSPAAHGVRYSHNLVMTQLDTYYEIFEVLCSIGHLLYGPEFMAIPQKQLTRQFLTQLTVSAPDGRNQDGRYSALPITVLADGIHKSQSESFPSIQRLKQHMDEKLSADAQSFSYDVLDQMKIKVWFQQLSSRVDATSDRKHRHRNVANARENPDFMINAMLHEETDWSDGSDVDEYVAAFEESDHSSDDDDVDSAETDYLATIADHVAAMMPPEMSKKLPCYRFFRAGVSGCAAGDKCKFNHDTANAEMQALYVKASRNKRPGDSQQSQARRAGHRTERHHRRDDKNRRGIRRDHRS